MGRCCHCGNGVASGYWVRHCRVQDLTLDDIGTESLSWSLKTGLPGPTITQLWEITDLGSLMTKGDTALCYGVRYDTWMPTTEGELWNGRNYGGSDLILRTTPVIEWDAVVPPLGIDEYPYIQPVQFASRVNALMTETLPSGGNVVAGRISAIVCPHAVANAASTTLSSAAIVRPRYYRILHDGVPVTDILDGVDTSAKQIGRPVTDVSNSGWTGVGNPTVLAQNINETTAGESDYNYSDNNSVATIVHTCPATLEGYVNTGVTIRYRIARSDAGTIPGSGAPGNSLDVTVSVLSGVTVVASETRAVPADPTSYEWILSDAECVALSTTAARIRFVTTASGGGAGDERGCAVFWAEIESPADWSGVWTELESTAGFPATAARAWQLSESLQQYTLRRRKRIGIDVWYEVQKRSSSLDYHLYVGGYDSTVYGSGQNVSHGPIGVGVTFNNGFDPSRHSYKLTFNGGTWRPAQATGDEFTFSLSDYKAGSAGDTINESCCYNRYRVTTPRAGILLAWACEVPYLLMKDFNDPDWPASGNYAAGLVYVPENHVDAINKLERDGTGNIWSYWQSVGGHWKGDGETTFVPLFKRQDGATSTFTDADFVDFPAIGNDWPTSVTVTRVDQ